MPLSLDGHVRFLLLLQLLPFALVLVASAQQQVPPSTRVAVVESLPSAIAADLLPVFEAELAALLERDGYGVILDHMRLPDDATARLADRLAYADIVVTFGAAAAIDGMQALEGRAIPSVLAWVPYGLAHQLAAASGRAGSVGIVERQRADAAFVVAGHLLVARCCAPLRIGLLHPQGLRGDDVLLTHLAEAMNGALVRPLPFAVPQVSSALLDLQETVLATAMAAASADPLLDGYWLALDQAVPAEHLVRDIKAHTGKPVLYAAGEEAVAAGALMSLALAPESTARDAALLARQLMSATPPAEATPLAPRRIDFALNLTTAAALGIVPSHDLLELAGQRLYR